MVMLIAATRYRDCAAALTFLTEVLEMGPHAVFRDDDGTIQHAQLRVGRGMLMIGPEADTPFGAFMVAPREVGMPTAEAALGTNSRNRNRRLPAFEAQWTDLPHVAALAARRLAAMHGQNTPAVIVVTYGNREFEDALIEMCDISAKAGFYPIAACTFVGEHSFSNPEMPIADGRPDSLDLKTARTFGAQISNKLKGINDLKPSHCPEVPGNRPYKDGMGQLPFTPLLLETRCTRCEACLSVCPSGALSLDSAIEIDRELCIFCCACIKVCPESALDLGAPPLKEKRQWLYEQCRERKEPEVYV